MHELKKRLSSTKSKSGAGFTLIELLVVIAIIGLLLSVVVVSLGNARMKSRDGRRLSDAHQIKSGLEIYYNTGQGYPDAATWNALAASSGVLSCSGVSAITVPKDPQSSIGNNYVYSTNNVSSPGCGGTVYSNYKLQFQTEGETGLGPAGTYFLSPSGITTTAPF